MFWGKQTKTYSPHYIKYLPKNIVSPMWIEIFADSVVIAHIKGRNAVMFLIKDKEIAKGYLDYFRLIWGISDN